ncbi:phosphate/phosphite/phosphonate ABC transporter substrate-binding protein [Solwaraspora sp. WMMB335]|uniref:phosphate/phosphite/phosphonate ABC transporter substrate-binding protein n=1 Tax=Solwaraspora sp. WMMB335 TaxID=3404118 RepID=UPI003B95E90C
MICNWVRVAGTVVVLVALTVAGCAPDADPADPSQLVLGVIPYENSTSVADDWKPFAAMLERQTGKRVEIKIATDYAALVEGQRAGTIHLAVYGPLSYVLARDSGVGVEPMGVQITHKGAPPHYRAYLVAKADAPIHGLADLRGKRVCFVDPNSTSGYLYPMVALTEAGIARDDYTERFVGGHDAAVLGVRDGDCDAAAVQDRIVDEVLPAEGRIRADELKTIWTSRPIINGPLAMSTRLQPRLRDKLAWATTEHGNADALGVPTIAGVWGFAPVTDESYDSVRAVCAVAKVKLCDG